MSEKTDKDVCQESLKSLEVDTLDLEQIAKLEELIDTTKKKLRDRKKKLKQKKQDAVSLGQTEDLLSQKMAIHHFINSITLTCHSGEAGENYQKNADGLSKYYQKFRKNVLIDPNYLKSKVQQYLQYSSWSLNENTNMPPKDVDLSLGSNDNNNAGSIWMIRNAASFYNWIDLYRNDVMKTSRFYKLVGLGMNDLDFIESMRWCGHLHTINSTNADNNIPDLKDYLNRIFILTPHDITENNEITKDHREKLVDYFCEEVIHNIAVSLYECLCGPNMYPHLMDFTAKCVGNAVSNGSVSNYQTLKIVTVVISNIREQWLLTFGLSSKRDYDHSFIDKITNGVNLKDKMIWKKVKHSEAVVAMIKKKNTVIQLQLTDKKKSITWKDILNEHELQLSNDDREANLKLCQTVFEVTFTSENDSEPKQNLFVPDMMIVMEHYVSTIDKSHKVDDDTVWKQYYKVSEFVNQEANDILPDCLRNYESSDARDNVPHSNTYKAAYKKSEDKWLAFQESVDLYNKEKKENLTEMEQADDKKEQARVNAMQVCQNQWLEAIMIHIKMDTLPVNQRKEICKLLLYKPIFPQQNGVSISLNEGTFEKMSWKIDDLKPTRTNYNFFLAAQKELIFLCVRDYTSISTESIKIKEDLIQKFTNDNSISDCYNNLKKRYTIIKKLSPNDATDTDTATQNFILDWLVPIIYSWGVMRKAIEGGVAFTNKTIQDADTAQANSASVKGAVYRAMNSNQIIVKNMTEEELNQIIRFAELSEKFWNSKTINPDLKWTEWTEGISFAGVQVRLQNMENAEDKVFAENFSHNFQSLRKKIQDNQPLNEAITKYIFDKRPRIIGYCLGMLELKRNDRLQLYSELMRIDEAGR